MNTPFAPPPPDADSLAPIRDGLGDQRARVVAHAAAAASHARARADRTVAFEVRCAAAALLATAELLDELRPSRRGSCAA